MAKANPSTIILKGDGVQKEGIADAAITPGYLVEVMTTGNIRKHAGAGLNTQAAFALENEVIGEGIDDAYAIADNCIYSVLGNGAEVYALVANAVVVVVGSYLESAGDGTLRPLATSAATADTARESAVAISLEAFTATGETRCRVAIL